jgi:thymidylate kinase
MHSVLRIFVRVLYDQGSLKLEQMLLLTKIVNILQSKLNRKEQFIYLRLTPTEAFKRYKLRGRAEESKLHERYFERLHNCMDEWLLAQEVNVSVVDANKDPSQVYQEVVTILQQLGYKI